VLTEVLTRATLRVPAAPTETPPRGRLGSHGPELAELVGTLQSLARQHPDATW
jgi:ring-1,2-phenylacetyl-CoA epoxidase subunit PaaC